MHPGAHVPVDAIRHSGKTPCGTLDNALCVRRRGPGHRTRAVVCTRGAGRLSAEGRTDVETRDHAGVVRFGPARKPRGGGARLRRRRASRRVAKKSCYERPGHPDVDDEGAEPAHQPRARWALDPRDAAFARCTFECESSQEPPRRRFWKARADHPRSSREQGSRLKSGCRRPRATASCGGHAAPACSCASAAASCCASAASCCASAAASCCACAASPAAGGDGTAVRRLGLISRARATCARRAGRRQRRSNRRVACPKSSHAQTPDLSSVDRRAMLAHQSGRNAAGGTPRITPPAGMRTPSARGRTRCSLSPCSYVRNACV